MRSVRLPGRGAVTSAPPIPLAESARMAAIGEPDFSNVIVMWAIWAAMSLMRSRSKVFSLRSALQVASASRLSAASSACAWAKLLLAV